MGKVSFKTVPVAAPPEVVAKTVPLIGRELSLEEESVFYDLFQTTVHTYEMIEIKPKAAKVRKHLEAMAQLIVKQIDHALAEQALALAVNAVWISALLHGLSAVPGAKWYAKAIALQGDCAETMSIKTSAKPLMTRDLNSSKS